MNDKMIRDFKGIWIPKEVWLDTRLGALDKIILVEIDSLDANEEGCYASNQYLADFCQCTETKISTSVSKLIQLRYIEILKFDGRKRFLKSRLKKIERQTLNNLKADFKKINDINIYNNINNNNNIYNIYGEFKNVKLTEEEYKKLEEKKLLPYIEKLSAYMKSKGKRYKSHYATILNWSRKDTKVVKVDTIPNWFDKEQDVKILSKNEIEEMENILKEIGE